MKNKTMKNGHPFTLIELLVVVAIIAILAGILLPALSRAKDLSYNPPCKSKIKQLLFYVQMYAQDHNDWMPYVPGFASEFKCWAAYDSCIGTKAYVGYRWCDMLADDIAKVKASLFSCPRAVMEASSSTERYCARISYGWNNQFVTYKHPTLKLSAVKKPARVMLLIETGYKDGYEQAYIWQAFKEATTWNNKQYRNIFFGKRHNNKGNIGYIDGHAGDWSGSMPEKDKYSLWWAN